MSIYSGLSRMIPGPVKAALKNMTSRNSAQQPLLEQRYSTRHGKINDAAMTALENSIATNYHIGWRARERYSAQAYEKDLKDHLFRRLDLDRNELVPWLDSLRPLAQSKILEIGCGTGSSTIALAEQGASVTGVDIDQGASKVAIDRCKMYGVEAAIRVVNAVAIDTEFRNTGFDCILFFACLEHMTIGERIDALAKAWTMLPPGGMLGVIETPNRLWHYDQHTSMLPFFHWLPDELAFRYSRFSPRENFHELYREWDAANAEHFQRRGRGVSYHEFDLSIRPVQELAIAGSLVEFRTKSMILRKNPDDEAYKTILHRQCPAVPMPFFEKQLDFVLRKE